MNPSEIFKRMREDHKSVLREIAILESAARMPGSARNGARWPGADVERVLDLLARQFETHMAAEDEVLYPALADALPEARHSIDPLLADHEALRMMLSDLAEGLATPANAARDEQLAVQMGDLVDLLKIHIRKEEALVIGVAERVLRPPEIEVLAARLTQSEAKRIPHSTPSPAHGAKRSLGELR